MGKTYTEKLQDPRWQKKRLEVMQRAGFRCEKCGNSRLALNVHHGYYLSGRDPWDYPDDALHCLCERCHEHITKAIAILSALVSRCPFAFATALIAYANEQAAKYAPAPIPPPPRLKPSKPLPSFESEQDEIEYLRSLTQKARVVDLRKGYANHG